MRRKTFIAIDIGGTSTSFGFVTIEGKILFRMELETGRSSDPNELVSRLKNEIERSWTGFKSDYEIAGAGIGAPNANYLSGTVDNPVNLNWKGIVPIVKIFEQALNIPVKITNDANAAALGEMLFGSAGNLGNFIFITLGTGLGSGIVVNNSLLNGNTGFAGEIGHIIIVENGRKCGCGRHGCLEQYCSATGMVKTYNELLHENNKKALIEETDSKYIFQKASNGEELALRVFEITGKHLGFALANVAACLDPAAIFLGGGLTEAGDLLFDPVKRYFEKNLFPAFRNKIEILPSGLPGNDAALLGAASIIVNEFKNNFKNISHNH